MALARELESLLDGALEAGRWNRIDGTYRAGVVTAEWLGHQQRILRLTIVGITARRMPQEWMKACRQRCKKVQRKLEGGPDVLTIDVIP